MQPARRIMFYDDRARTGTFWLRTCREVKIIIIVVYVRRMQWWCLGTETHDGAGRAESSSRFTARTRGERETHMHPHFPLNFFPQINLLNLICKLKGRLAGFGGAK